VDATQRYEVSYNFSSRSQPNKPGISGQVAEAQVGFRLNSAAGDTLTILLLLSSPLKIPGSRWYIYTVPVRESAPELVGLLLRTEGGRGEMGRAIAFHAASNLLCFTIDALFIHHSKTIFNSRVVYLINPIATVIYP